jgi:hypothetical protein
MSDNLKFESRTGKLNCTAREFFDFITDIRNFEQFIPDGSIKNWQAYEERCSFQITPFGTANVKIKEKVANSLVQYSGDVLKDNEFELSVHISENDSNLAEVRLTLTADLNPFLKMMATEPVKRFMELLISEMEKFDKWKGR